MRVASALLFALASAAPHGAEVQAGEGLVEVPGVLSPIITLPQVLADLSAFSETAEQQQSFFNAVLTGQAASAAAVNVRLCTFSRGLWRVTVSVHYLSNFTQVSDGSIAENRVILVDPDGNGKTLVQFPAVNGVPVHLVLTLEVLVNRGGWFMQHRLSATALGQTQQVTTAIVALRLL